MGEFLLLEAAGFRNFWSRVSRNPTNAGDGIQTTDVKTFLKVNLDRAFHRPFLRVVKFPKNCVRPILCRASAHISGFFAESTEFGEFPAHTVVSWDLTRSEISINF